MKFIAILIFAGVIVLGSLVMAERVEDSHTRRIQAETRLLQMKMLDEANDRIFAMAIMGGLAMFGIAVIAVCWAVHDRAYYRKFHPNQQSPRIAKSRPATITHNHYHQSNYYVVTDQRYLPRSEIKYISAGK